MTNYPTVRDLIIHLRLRFQLLLAPIYLWGFYLANGQLGSDFWLGFLAFHLFLYGGTTAFNSYYDRDEGPVGGLEKPPPVQEILLPFSLVMQAIGALLAVWVNLPFFIIYLVIFLMGAAYSYPSLRWKARPFGGLATVGIGQGILAGLGGWVVAQPDLGELTLNGILGILAISLVTVGFYPLTQIYQIDEDAQRGDVTFAVWAGPEGVFRFSIAVLGGSSLLLVWIIGQQMGWIAVLLVGGVYCWLLFSIVQWARRFDESDVIENFRNVMRIYTISSGGFLIFISVYLLASSL